jgi:hypothetical protein
MLLLALAVLELPCASASAGTVGVSADGSRAFFVSGPDEANEIVYSHGPQNGEYTFVERNKNVALTPGNKCTSPSARVVVCIEPKIALLGFTMGNGDDFLHGAPDATTPRVSVDGGPGNDTLGGGHGDDHIVGGDGNDNLNPSGASAFAGATDGNDRLVGQGGNDILRGFAGADSISGGDGADDVSGGTENDVVVAGDEGNDIVNGGPGDDTIRTVGGSRDRVSCGPGRDRVFKDRSDVVGRDCEVVNGRKRGR